MGVSRTFSALYRLSTVNAHGFSIRSYSSLRKNFNSDDGILPVLIVGAGPVGLALSILLTKLGVKCAILEQSKSFSQHPQAHFINNRSMEIFRKLDNLAEEIQSLQPPVDLWRKFIYCTSLNGSVLGSVDHIEPQGHKFIIQQLRPTHVKTSGYGVDMGVQQMRAFIVVVQEILDGCHGIYRAGS